MVHSWILTYRFVGLFLACVFGCSAGVSSHLHVHGVDDVKEVLHHSYSLQRRVFLGRIPIWTLKHRQEFSRMPCHGNDISVYHLRQRSPDIKGSEWHSYTWQERMVLRADGSYCGHAQDVLSSMRSTTEASVVASFKGGKVWARPSPRVQCLKITPHTRYRTGSPSYNHPWRSCCWPCRHRNCHWFLPGRCAWAKGHVTCNTSGIASTTASINNTPHMGLSSSPLNRPLILPSPCSQHFVLLELVFLIHRLLPKS